VGSDGRHAAVVTNDNELQVFDQGKWLWTERLPGRVITPPLVAGERVFVQAVDRSVRGYDALDGRWLWQYQRPGGEPLALATSGVLGAFRDTCWSDKARVWLVWTLSRVLSASTSMSAHRVAPTKSSVWPI
jgi:outer membrane protein assembly factor BamB